MNKKKRSTTDEMLERMILPKKEILEDIPDEEDGKKNESIKLDVKKKNYKEMKQETKSERIQLLLEPSMLKDLQILASIKKNQSKKNVSVNSLVRNEVVKLLKREQELINKYKEIFTDN